MTQVINRALYVPLPPTSDHQDDLRLFTRLLATFTVVKNFNCTANTHTLSAKRVFTFSTMKLKYKQNHLTLDDKKNLLIGLVGTILFAAQFFVYSAVGASCALISIFLLNAKLLPVQKENVKKVLSLYFGISLISLLSLPLGIILFQAYCTFRGIQSLDHAMKSFFSFIKFETKSAKRTVEIAKLKNIRGNSGGLIDPLTQNEIKPSEVGSGQFIVFEDEFYSLFPLLQRLLANPSEHPITKFPLSPAKQKLLFNKIFERCGLSSAIFSALVKKPYPLQELLKLLQDPLNDALKRLPHTDPTAETGSVEALLPNIPTTQQTLRESIISRILVQIENNPDSPETYIARVVLNALLDNPDAPLIQPEAPDGESSLDCVKTYQCLPDETKAANGIDDEKKKTLLDPITMESISTSIIGTNQVVIIDQYYVLTSTLLSYILDHNFESKLKHPTRVGTFLGLDDYMLLIEKIATYLSIPKESLIAALSVTQEKKMRAKLLLLEYPGCDKNILRLLRTESR